jgi:hypothetical protein
MEDAAMIAQAAVFVLWVTIGSAPSYQRGDYPTYDACAVAAQAEVETLPEYRQKGGRWDCVPGG